MKQDITHLLSKYGRILCLGMLTAFAVAACQKDDRTVVLNAVISEQTNSNAKVYVEGNTAYWQHGDKVKVNGTECDVSVTAPSTTTARIINVGEATEYTAGYPSEYTTHVNDGSLKIEIPHDHVYEVANRYDGSGDIVQRVVSPMAAYTEDGTTLMFQNVASLLEVEIENESIDHEITLYAVEVVSDNAPLSGILPVSFNAEGAMTANPSDATATQKSVIMHFTGVGSSVVLDKSSGSGTKTAKVYIPILPILEGKKSNLTVHVMATGDDNMKYTFHKTSVTSGGVWIARNAMGSISCKLNSTTCAGENDYFWGKGSPTCPYIIENEADLIRLRDLVNGSGYGNVANNNSEVYYLQTENITLSGNTWGKKDENNPIGINTGYTIFNANYNGGGHWVNINNTDLTDDDFADNGCVGLFGVAGGGGSIRNLTVKGTLNTVGKNLHVGGVVGRISGAFTIDTCRNEINLSTVNANATQYYGGICGCIQAGASSTVVDIKDCINNGDISRDDYGQIGGICGYIQSGKVTFLRDTNAATISGSAVDNNQYTGGICAACTSWTKIGTIKYDYCINSGLVASSTSTQSRVGGIMGYASSYAEFENCKNKKRMDGSSVINTVSGNQFIGGIVGFSAAANTLIKNCDNEGKCSGTNHVGGILGRATSKVTISECNNDGPISCVGISGGIVGELYGNNDYQISDCVNKSNGSITGTGGQIGGICGLFTYVNIVNCTNKGPISSTKTAKNVNLGGIVGDCSEGTINNCHNLSTGILTATSCGANNDGKVGGIVGYCANTNTPVINITNCHNEAAIYTSAKQTGGIVGYANAKNMNIFNCYNTGSINATGTQAGGIVGFIYNQVSSLQIKGCYNTGLFSSSKNTFAPLIYASYNTSYVNVVSSYALASVLTNATFSNNNCNPKATFTGYGTIGEVKTALLDNLNAFVTANNSTPSNPTCYTWIQSKNENSNPTELPHF